jgi:pentatricopeptide repeat protein
MMLQNGVQPGRATYHFIISGLINDDRLVDAVECLKKMRENGKMPTKDTWFMILNACADAKKWQLGSQVLKELDESKFEVRSDALLRVYRLVRAQCNNRM